MKKIALVLFALGLTQVSCKKSKTCTCKDDKGTVVFNETTKVSGKTQASHFETDCQNRTTTYYHTTGSVTTSTTIPCVIS